MLEKVVQTGRQAALAAGAVLRRNYYQPHQITMKGAIDPVTESDLQAQEMIIALIRQIFPDHGFLAEETTGEGVAQAPSPVAGYRWIIDPLDGTVNFAHGYPAFCVSIAFEAAGRLEYGVIYDPLRDELFEARRGQGSSLNGQPIKVSTIDRLERALVATGFPYDIRERLPETLARLGRMVGVVQGVRRAGSAALDMCYVACGRFDGFWESKLKPWDLAAGVLMAREAGAVASDLDGGERILETGGIIVAAPRLHPQMAALVRAAPAPR